MRKDAVSKKTTAKIEKLAEGVLKAVAGGRTRPSTSRCALSPT